jgi:hypothetical protein
MTAGEAVKPSWELWKQTDNYRNHLAAALCVFDSEERAEDFIYTVFLQGYLHGTQGK